MFISSDRRKWSQFRSVTVIVAGLPYARKVASMADLDPLEAIDQEEYDDPNPEEVTDPNHPDYIAPAKNIKSVGGGK